MSAPAHSHPLLPDVLALPDAAKVAWLRRMHAHRQRLAGPVLGAGTRLWPSPGALAAEHEPSTGLQTAQLSLLDDELVAVADGATRRLAFYMPPQEGKSQRVSRRFPTWLLGADPTLRIVICSYESGRAVRWGRQIKRDVESDPRLGVVLTEDSRAAGRWQTVEGGGVYCVGIGGSLTGEPADVLIIDDPVKGRAEAESLVYREGAWEWYENTARTRLSDRARVVLVMTRWHEDDLGGRLELHEAADWRVVSIPAVADSAHDPLGRKVGEPLISVQGRPATYYTDLAHTTSQYVWLSVYQQRPTAAHGNLFKRNAWRYWRPAGNGQVQVGTRTHWWSDLWRFATIDLAASTKRSADYTVVSCWGMAPGGDLLLLDRVREQVGEEAHSLLVLPLQERYGLDTVFIERGFIGTTLVRDLATEGVKVSPLEPDADKTTRALPAANRVAQGRVFLRAGAPWLDEWINEHAQFPNGAHDDQVDTLAYAARVAGAHFAPNIPGALATVEREAARADTKGLDIDNAVW